MIQHKTQKLKRLEEERLSVLQRLQHSLEDFNEGPVTKTLARLPKRKSKNKETVH